MAPISDIQDEEKPAKVVTPDEQDSEDSIVSDRDPEPAVPEERIDVIPDGGYGWVCVACCFLINAHTWGINSVSQNIFARNSKKDFKSAKQYHSHTVFSFLTT